VASEDEEKKAHIRFSAEKVCVVPFLGSKLVSKIKFLKFENCYFDRGISRTSCFWRLCLD